MRLVDRLNEETSAFHADVDHQVFRMRGTTDEYRDFLVKSFGFLAPVERAITETTEVGRYLDLRRFNKEELLRRDLLALRLDAAQIDALPQCTIPRFESVEEALGWAYFVERGTLVHNTIFMHFAGTIPGDVAFASSFLKCYFWSVGEMWRGFSEALDHAERIGEERVRRLIDAAKAAFRVYRGWHAL